MATLEKTAEAEAAAEEEAPYFPVTPPTVQPNFELMTKNFSLGSTYVSGLPTQVWRWAEPMSNSISPPESKNWTSSMGGNSLMFWRAAGTSPSPEMMLPMTPCLMRRAANAIHSCS